VGGWGAGMPSRGGESVGVLMDRGRTRCRDDPVLFLPRRQATGADNALGGPRPPLSEGTGAKHEAVDQERIRASDTLAPRGLRCREFRLAREWDRTSFTCTPKWLPVAEANSSPGMGSSCLTNVHSS